jgi:hypothetical protein
LILFHYVGCAALPGFIFWTNRWQRRIQTGDGMFADRKDTVKKGWIL